MADERAPLTVALLGASGNVGAKIRDEALDRGHAVTALVRDTSALPSVERLRPVAVDAHDIPALAAAFDGHELAIVSVRWDSNDVLGVVEALRTSGVPRVIIVIGAGSLKMPDGRLYYQHLLDKGIDPPTSRAALAAYRELQQIADVDWTAVSPAASIAAGERTGVFRLGADDLVRDANGDSKISQEDFAVAVLDEAERPTRSRERFTVGY